MLFVTLDHKTSHKGPLFYNCFVCYDRTIFENLESEGVKKSKY